MKIMATFLLLLISLFGCAPPPDNNNSDEFGKPNYETIDGIWRVRADEIHDTCNNAANPCVEGENDDCIYTNEWFWVTVQDYTDGVFIADFTMSDLYWEDVVIENGVFDIVLDLSDFGWLYRIYGTMIPSNETELGEMTATIELGKPSDSGDAKFGCRIIYELKGFPLYDANSGAREALEDSSSIRYSPLFF